jgi:hypothetical protein
MKKAVFCLFNLVLISMLKPASAQESIHYFNLTTLAGYTTPDVVPFWLRSNQFGSIPVDGASLSLAGSFRKDYDPAEGKLFDWGTSFEGRVNFGEKSNMTLIEGYGKVRLGIFELRAGRSKKITGLCDTLLTSGSWSISGTSPGIPEVELSVREYWSVPWFGQLFAFKGNFSHGWIGDTPMLRWFDEGDTVLVNTFIHQKSLYGRLGKPSWKLKLYGGFNHQVTWGNEADFYTRDFELTPLQTFFYVLTGKRYSNGFIESTRLGNHLGSIDLGLEYDFGTLVLLIYRQNFYESGALAYLANIQDGLNGVSLRNKAGEKHAFSWDRLLVEFLYTKNQAGEPWSPEYGSPYEGYYWHGEYMNGWSYNGIGLGTPFIGTRDVIRAELPAAPEEYFINNRLYAVHLGFEGSIKEMRCLVKASYSKNFGTYWTTDEEQSTDIPNPGDYGIFGEQDQFSAYLELNRKLNNGLNIGFVGAFDIGELYYNSFGLFLKASYSFSL